MKRVDSIPPFQRVEPTLEELAQSKRIADRAVLLRHVDHIIRPPAWVYEEIEEAIQHALAGNHTVRIESRDGCRYTVAELVERWELDEELLGCYARPLDDAAYRDF